MNIRNKTLSLLSLLLFVLVSHSQDSLSLGEFIITKVVDGDTFKFDKLDKSARLLCIDTEETFKGDDAEAKSNDLARNWTEFYSLAKAKGKNPAKVETPFGYKTWQWTKELFKNVVKVRIELEEKNRVFDFFGRYLAYIIAIKKDGTEFNYNVECVKQGYSPYFSKYGYSKRFHQQFVDAQNYARENKLAIWSGNELCYPDYPERLEWWDRRAEMISKFEYLYKGREGYYSVLDDDYDLLKDKIGQEVILFGSIADILDKKDPYLIRLSHTQKEHVDIVLFPENYSLMDELKIRELDGEYIYVSGKLELYKERPQIKLTSKSQIWQE